MNTIRHFNYLTYLLKISSSLILFIIPLISFGQNKFSPGIICTDKNEYGLTFITEDWICFTRTLETNTLMFSRQINGKWSEPTIAPFSGIYSDEYPRFGTKNNRLFFASKRPTNNDESKSANDIWYVELKNNNWSAPKYLSGSFSTDGIDSGAEFSNGLIYFHSDRKGKGLNDVDIYSIPFNKPDKAATYLTISSDQVDGEPYIFNKGHAMLFMSAGHNAVGNSDIFLSLCKKGNWQTPTSVDTTGLINTPEWEYSPVLSPDLSKLYFTRYENGQADIFQVDVKSLSNSDLKEIAKIE